ncbi:translation initiation factor IF-3, partial [Candidatus Nomurabacteria bacterium]|nr:translation initiation factor IF-3 [Candidatus Nomurabacteria bacterium]
MTNNEIRFGRVRLIDSNGDMLGVVSIDEARRKADERDLDLVLISASPDNPVCKIMDYKHFLYDQKQKAKEAKKNQVGGEVLTHMNRYKKVKNI